MSGSERPRWSPGIARQGNARGARRAELGQPDDAYGATQCGEAV